MHAPQSDAMATGIATDGSNGSDQQMQDQATQQGQANENNLSSDQTHALILAALDDAKAEDVISIDLSGKSTIGDYMIIATGRSNRHVGAIADQISKLLKQNGFGRSRIEGMPACDWVLIDVGDVVLHIFRPEVRDFYNLEKMWSLDHPGEAQSQ